MDIYEYLKMDYKKFEKLFDLYLTAPTMHNQKEIVLLLKKELSIHAKAKFTSFYKELESHPDCEEDIIHGKQEEEEIIAKLTELANAPQPSEKTMLALKEKFCSHIEDEENNLLVNAKKILSADQACIQKFKMHDYKEKLLNGIEMKEEILV